MFILFSLFEFLKDFKVNLISKNASPQSQNHLVQGIDKILRIEAHQLL